MTKVKELINQGKFDEARLRLLELARITEDFTEFMDLSRLYKRIVATSANPQITKHIRVAILGSVSTELLETPLTLALEAFGFSSVLYRGNFNTQVWDMINSDSPLVEFRPHIVILVQSPQNILNWPEPGNDIEQVKKNVEDECNHLLNLCAQIHGHTNCDIILDNFHYPDVQPMGNMGAKIPWDESSFILRTNLALGEHAPAYVHISDVARLACRIGTDQWFDPRYWFHSKQPMSFGCVVVYIRNMARIIRAIYGRSAKCLVLDLDNTLWGGVVGDDGIDGIKVGQGNAVGEAFLAFQKYILKLKQRGVMLAVCSKNEEENAKAPFLSRSDMVLKLDDFVAFKANWNTKPDNLQDIALELNIGLDSLVFVDDNPAERVHVKKRLPEVKVVELTDDPAEYPRILDRTGWFEAVTLTKEDRQKTEQYRDNKKRLRLRESVSDYNEYLRGLKQKASVRPFEARYFDRITQLINKSNQFNLTTKREHRSDIESYARDENMLTRYVTLTDIFGDNGLISVFYARKSADIFKIEQWLMSCRVLNRTVEQLLLNIIASEAKKSGAKALEGLYIPTKKNKLVEKHYEKLGFKQVETHSDGSTSWRLELENFEPLTTWIEYDE